MTLSCKNLTNKNKSVTSVERTAVKKNQVHNKKAWHENIVQHFKEESKEIKVESKHRSTIKQQFIIPEESSLSSSTNPLKENNNL